MKANPNKSRICLNGVPNARRTLLVDFFYKIHGFVIFFTLIVCLNPQIKT